eukprot:gene4543-9015_t
MNPQVTLAKRLLTAKEKPSRKKLSKIPASDPLPLSKEMVGWLKDTLEYVDDDGFLPLSTGSVMAPPLDAMSVFCPTANTILNYKVTAPKVPESDLRTRTISPNTFDKSFSNVNTWSSSHSSIGSSPSQTISNFENENIPSNVTDNIARMEVLWLQRRAEFEREEGNLNQSLETLNEAIQIHIGTNKYENANLTDKVISSNPQELFQSVQDNYFVYDIHSHILASRIQRLYHKRYLKKIHASIIISKFYRGHIIRKNKWYKNNLKLQCIILIQRRFKIHLKKIHKLATKIKRWFKLRQEMRDYSQRLYHYRLARRIQRLYRGVQGRRKAIHRRHLLHAVYILQRNIRGYIVRQRRAFIISLYHKMYYTAARTIQCLCRKVLAIQKAQNKLFEVLSSEEKRSSEEKIVRDEAVRVEMRRASMYIETDAGKKHLATAMEAVQFRDIRFENAKENLLKYDILSHNALVAYELFDLDGSGFISKDSLYLLLRELCVPVTKQDMDEIELQLEVDNLGLISFNTFLNWYANSNYLVYNGGTISRTICKKYLNYKNKLKEKLQINLYKRAKNELIRQRCAWIIDTATALYRTTNPPKYQCCRCLYAFALFTDYYIHFNKRDKSCSITSEKGMFFPKFWIQHDWLKQRQCELEVIRVRNEQPWVFHKASLAIVLQCLAKYLKRPLPDGWLYDDMVSITSVEHWLQSEIDKKGLHGGLRNENRIDLIIRSLPYTESHIHWKESLVLAKIHVYCLRLMQIPLEASILAQNEYRKKLPRKIKLNDNELRKVGLLRLTLDSYTRERTKLITNLAHIDASMLSIIASEYDVKTKYNRYTSYINNVILSRIFSSRYSPISPNNNNKLNSNKSSINNINNMNILPHTIDDLLLVDAHVRAQARYEQRIRTRIGKTQIRRKTCELWASELLMLKQKSNSEMIENPEKYVKFRYIFDLYRSIVTMEGIDIRDFNMMEKDLGIHIYTEAENERMMSELDPGTTGFITEELFLQWIKYELYKKYKNFPNIFSNFIIRTNNKLFDIQYKKDAKLNILINIRRICRLEVETAHAYMNALIPIILEDRTLNLNAALKYRENIENDSLDTLLAVNAEDERGELILLHRIAADNAEWKCKISFVSSRNGWYKLQTEKMIIAESKTMMSAYSSVLTNGITSTVLKIINNSTNDNNNKNKNNTNDDEYSSSHNLDHWGVLVKPLLLAFDTDCSGSFDEDEVHMIFKFLYRDMSERSTLLAFPEVRNSTVVLERLTQALTSWMMLICLSRQMAWELSQTASLVTHSARIVNTSTSTQDENKNQESLIYRCQILAMRQVKIYLKSIFGKIQKMSISKKLKNILEIDISEKKEEDEALGIEVEVEVSANILSVEDVILHAYRIHEDWKGMLVTELPHMIQYLIHYWNFKQTDRIIKIGKTISKIICKNRLFWLNEDEILNLIQPTITTEENIRKHWKKNRIQKQTRDDGGLSMLSQARQQALMIALKFKEIRVSETNYRCLILGLHKVIKLHAYKAKWGIFKMNIDNQLIDWKFIPKETVLLQLLSYGYTLENIYENLDEKFKNDFLSFSSFKHGILAKDLIESRIILNETKKVKKTFKNLLIPFEWDFPEKDTSYGETNVDMLRHL